MLALVCVLVTFLHVKTSRIDYSKLHNPRLIASNFGKGRRGHRKSKYNHNMKRFPFSEISKRPAIFKAQLQVSLEEFLEIYEGVKTQFGGKKLHLKGIKLPFIEQLYLVFFWLAQYPHYSVLCHLFGISNCTVSKIISHLLPILAFYFVQYIPEERISTLHSSLDPSIKFIMDATIKPIRRPSGRQRAYYNGHYKFHGINTHILLDYDGMLPFLTSVILILISRLDYLFGYKHSRLYS